MYCKHATQLQFEYFYLPFGGRLCSDNRWVILVKLIPWDDFETQYADTLTGSGMGCPDKSVRIALGSLIIKERFGTSGEETVAQIQENLYFQYFLGFHEYRDTPSFDPFLFVHFRKRLGADLVMAVNDCIAQRAVSPLSPSAVPTSEKHLFCLICQSLCLGYWRREPPCLSSFTPYQRASCYVAVQYLGCQTCISGLLYHIVYGYG